MWQRKIHPVIRSGIKLMWNYITPAYVLGQFVLNSYIYSQALIYKRNPWTIYHFPQWAIGLGWTLAYFSVIFIPMVAIVKICRLKHVTGSVLDKMKYLCKPILKHYMVLEGADPNSYILEALEGETDVEERPDEPMLAEKA